MLCGLLIVYTFALHKPRRVLMVAAIAATDLAATVATIVFVFVLKFGNIFGGLLKRY